MENNSIHPDDMERLLREAFLNSPESETDKIADMMSDHVYSKNWNVVPPADKVQHFIPKKYFFKGFSLNGIIVSTTVAVGISVGTYFAWPSKKPVMKPTPAQNTQLVAPIKNDTVQQILETQPQLQIASVVEPKKEPSKKQVQATDTTKTKQTTYQTPPPVSLPKPKAKRYILIPEISKYEAAQNEKRKAEMIRQVSRAVADEWAYIPMGTSTIDNKQISLYAFYMQTHEVSNLQYRTFLYDLVINDKLLEYEKAAVYDSGWVNISKVEPYVEQYFWNPSFNDYPVVNISLYGAQMYCDWLTGLVNNSNQDKGKPFINDIRLPSVEEWIYAAKADNDSAVYAWGGPFYRNSKGLILGNFKSGRNIDDHDGADVTALVGSFYPNPWGLHNMSGNVAEMTAPFSDGTLYVKGGAWNLQSEYMKVAYKHKIQIDDLPTTNVGFRPVFTFIDR